MVLGVVSQILLLQVFLKLFRRVVFSRFLVVGGRSTLPPAGVARLAGRIARTRRRRPLPL